MSSLCLLCVIKHVVIHHLSHANDTAGLVSVICPSQLCQQPRQTSELLIWTISCGFL